MKKLLIIGSLVLGAALITCEKVSVPKQTDQQSNLLTERPPNFDLGAYVFGKCDNWSITGFRKNDVNMTVNYAAFGFEFCPGNAVHAYNDIMSFPGRWQFVANDGGPRLLLLSFNPVPAGQTDLKTGTLLGDITGNWTLKRVTYDYISLVMKNNERDVRELVFERKVRTQD